MSLPSIDHPTGQPNLTIVNISDRRFAFSYNTIIGYVAPETDFRWIVSENCWSTTTGKHLNWLSSGEPRVPREEFEEQLKALVK